LPQKRFPFVDKTSLKPKLRSMRTWKTLEKTVAGGKQQPVQQQSKRSTTKCLLWHWPKKNRNTN